MSQEGRHVALRWTFGGKAFSLSLVSVMRAPGVLLSLGGSSLSSIFLSIFITHEGWILSGAFSALIDGNHVIFLPDKIYFFNTKATFHAWHDHPTYFSYLLSLPFEDKFKVGRNFLVHFIHCCILDPKTMADYGVSSQN